MRGPDFADIAELVWTTLTLCDLRLHKEVRVGFDQ